MSNPRPGRAEQGLIFGSFGIRVSVSCSRTLCFSDSSLARAGPEQ